MISQLNPNDKDFFAKRILEKEERRMSQFRQAMLSPPPVPQFCTQTKSDLWYSLSSNSAYLTTTIGDTSVSTETTIPLAQNTPKMHWGISRFTHNPCGLGVLPNPPHIILMNNFIRCNQWHSFVFCSGNNQSIKRVFMNKWQGKHT